VRLYPPPTAQSSQSSLDSYKERIKKRRRMLGGLGGEDASPCSVKSKSPLETFDLPLGTGRVRIIRSSS